ncbi:MAG: cytochrome c biogenesis protein CcdA [Clostridia bacterium]|nr:cytochrome c biogenesis protein CcdA [Clostridia bacterium]
MNIISIGTSFIAGILSFVSPCVLPLVPAYISYITGSNIKNIGEGTSNNVKQTLIKSILFSLGFSIVFIIMGLTVTSISELLYKYKDILNKIAGTILIVLGINLMGLIKIKWLYKSSNKINLINFKGNAILIGIAFGFGWTPCVGPILAGILVFASNMETIFQGTMLLIIYSLGLAIPFVLTALSIEKLTKVFKKVSKHSYIISIVSGAMVAIIGILIFTNTLTKLSGVLL